MKITNIAIIKIIFFLLPVLTAGNVVANTVIFSQRYTADPAVIVYDGRVYIYASHDVKHQSGFKMDGYTCFSSDDMLNWTDHGEVLKASQISYVDHFWAPEAVYHNGKFYLYFCQDHVGTGVVESDSPIGPWTDVRGSLLMTGHKVDVGILIDDSGTPYAYWPNGPVKRLKQNMYEFEPGEWNTLTNDTHEGPDVFRANNRIYYSYMTFNDQELWSCAQHNIGCGDDPPFANYFHRYHFLDSPTGTAVEPGGVHGRTMMWPLYGDNTHPAVFEFHGQYYSFYHSKLLMTQRNEPGFHRNVGLDRLYFNPDDTIIPQAITKEGLRQVKYLNPYIQQDAATIGREHGINTLPTADEGGGRKVGFIDNGDWIKLFGVDFGSGASDFQARVASPIGGGTIQARLGAVNGPLVATLTVPNTGGWDSFTTVTTSVSEASGVHDLYFVFSGGFDFNWWKFDGGTVSNKIPPRVIKPVSLKGRTSNRYVTGSAGGLVPNSETVGVNQQFYLYDNENGTYSLFSKGMNAWVTDQNGALTAAKSSIEGNDEEFLLMHTPDGSYCLFSQSANSYIQAPHGTGALVSGIDQPWEEPYRSDSRFWIDYLDIPVTIASEPTYDFDAGAFQGWTDLTPPNSNSGPRHWALSPPAFPGVAHSGSVAIGQDISGGNQDSSHPTLWLRSPEFLLDGSGALRVWLRGGTGSGSLAGVPVASVPANSSSPGFQGVALRNAATQTFVLSGSRTSSGDSWEEIVFTASELATLDQNATYTLDLIDAGHGGWGWIAMDSVTIPGAIHGQEPAAPPTISSIAGQTILVNTNTDELAFTVGSEEVDPGALTLSGSSSNTTLAPDGNIVFGGSGAERTVTVTPSAAQTGSATITVTVSDAARTASTAFVVTVVSGALPIEFDFAAGALSGWTEASTDGQGRQFFAVVPPSLSSPNLTPHSGDHFIGLHIPGFDLNAGYTQDSEHDTLVLSSPEFTLNGEGDLTAWLSGGGSGSVSLAGSSVDALPGLSSTGGFLGVALRNVTTGTFVLSASKSGGGNEWEQVTFTEAQLVALPRDHVYTLDLIDARQGGWGWVNMDTVTIPGTLFDTMAGVPDGENLVPLPKIAFRLGGGTELLGQYRNNPDGYPVSKARIDYLHFDGTPGENKIDLFDSKQAFIERGAYDPDNPGFKPHEVRNRIRAYEDAGWDVAGVFVYREEWIYDPEVHGPFPNFDKRILSQEDIDNIREGIENADPPLKRSDYKIIQLLGGRVGGERGDSWLRMDQKMKEYLEQFDGIGTELHIDGQFDTEAYPYQSYTPVAMAEIARWAGEKNKLSFVFMGGLPHTYKNLTNTQATYHYLWDEMVKAGVNPRAEHLVYFRQGARDGEHTPESNVNTLTHQMKWLIEHLKNAAHISGVEVIDGGITFNFPPIQYHQSYIEFSIDGGESYPLRAAINLGTATFENLDAGTYNVWVRWGNGEYPVRLGTYTVNGFLPEPPTISAISDQTISVNMSTGALSFTVGSEEVSAGTMTLSGFSSNTTLVPQANIVFGGGVAERAVTVTPAAEQTGSATITVTVDDGFQSSSVSFTLVVLSGDEPVVNVVMNPAENPSADFFLARAWHWDTDGDTEGWVAGGNGHLSLDPGAPLGGLLSGISVDVDPLWLSPSSLGIVATEEMIIEFRIRKQREDGTRMDLFWHDSTGNFGGGRLQGIPADGLPRDGEFHVVRIHFSHAIQGILSRLRFDPISGTLGIGMSFDLDYFRIYTSTLAESSVPPRLAIERWGETQVRLSWPSAAAGWVLQRSADVGGEFTDANLEVTVEEDENVAYETIFSARQFYRLVE